MHHGAAFIITFSYFNSFTVYRTLRAIYADLFPTEKEGAFGTIVLFSGSASTIGYILSVTGALTCDGISQYCVEYNDGSFHNALCMEIIIITTALLAIPAFWKAVGYLFG